MSLLNFLPGMKTYFAGGGMVLLGIGQWLSNGAMIPPEPETVQMILEGLAIIFLRKGIKNA